jgi:predicted NAD/FAD-dependent oxidoreductase
MSNATDPRSAASLLEMETPWMNSCVTWYHSAPKGLIDEKALRVAPRSPILNTVVLSNTAPEYAPVGRSLIATTALGAISEKELLAELERIWDRNLGEINLICRYDIVDALPKKLAGSDLVEDVRTQRGIYVAGDWRAIPAQQGALLSGRLAAMAVIADLSTH